MVISRVGEIEVRATADVLILGLTLTGLSAVRLGGWHGLIGAGLLLTSLLFHEIGHLLMAQALGVKVRAVGLCLKGAYLRRSESGCARWELLIALAGPTANLLVYAWFRDGNAVLRWVAVLNLVLAVSNLIPVPGTDGARICQSLESLQRCRSRGGQSPKHSLTEK